MYQMTDAISDRTELARFALAMPDDVVAINAGSRGAICAAARHAMERADAHDRGDVFGVTHSKLPEPTSWYLERYERYTEDDRGEVAHFLGCAPDDVALCESTTVAMNILLWGCDLQPGDEIVTTSLENPGALVPVLNLARRRGLVVRMLELGNGEADLPAAFAAIASDRTRVVLISDVTYATGTRLDLAGLTAMAHAHGTLVFADGVQAAGTCAIDVAALGVDAYAFARHKFLCGPEGAGGLYVSSAARERLEPTFAGVFSDAGHGYGDALDLHDDARRFEVSTRALPAFAAGAACLRWLADDVGWDTRALRALSIAWCRGGFRR